MADTAEKFDHLFIQPRDWTKSFLFFTETLGWKVRERWGDEADAGRFAFIRNGEFEMILAEDHDTSDVTKKPAIYASKGRVSIHFNTDDLEASFARIKDGPHVVIRPEETHWGTRWFVVEDPDGNQFGWQAPLK